MNYVSKGKEIFYNTIYQGNVLEVLKTFPDETLDCVVTSPPYYGLRSYNTEGQVWGGDLKCEHDWVDHVRKPQGGRGSKHASVGANRNDEANLRDHDTVTNFCSKCGAWRGELGVEPDFKEYINHLCDVFDEVKRVLKPTGTCWVNIGDTYNGTGDKGEHKDPKSPEKRNGQSKAVNNVKSYPRKSLLQIPSRFAIEMVDRGWILRNEIIWHKPNAMPSPVKDRYTVDFEKIFFFTKSPKYYFEQQLEPYLAPMNRWGGEKLTALGESIWDKGTGQSTYRDRTVRPNPEGRNKRTVWQINTKPYKEAHVACYPVELIETPIKSGCPEGGIVLDPFMGSGTTAITALKNGRKYVGVELNSEYVNIAGKRINNFIYDGKLY